jgi:ADP-ribosylglycohydrolase
MLGAIAGDIIGSVYEWENTKSPDFQPLFGTYCRPTDDTILTIAVADWILRGYGDDLALYLKRYCQQYPTAGYGGTFFKWANSISTSPYGSWGNGSAMRVSPVGFAFDSSDSVLEQAKRSAEVTHDHPEGIKGAQATALAIFLARNKKSKQEIKDQIEETVGYKLNKTLDEIRPTYVFDVSCQGSVPQAIQAFLESTSYEDCVRKAISLGGDSDTIACIAGGIAHAFYGPLTEEIYEQTILSIPTELLPIVREFHSRFLPDPV